MTYFVVTQETTNECNSCCCKAVSGAPGEIDQWNLDFAPWAVPIGGKGISEIVADVRRIHVPTQSGAQLANGSFQTTFNTTGIFDLSTLLSDVPPGAAVAYERVPFYGPHRGTLTLNPDTGSATYAPRNGFSGYDRFFLVVTVGTKRLVAEVVIGVEDADGQLPAFAGYTPIVAIPDERINLRPRTYLADLAVVISPAAVIGEIYRVTIKATALDCDCNPFVNLSCYNLTIGKC